MAENYSFSFDLSNQHLDNFLQSSLQVDGLFASEYGTQYFPVPDLFQTSSIHEDPHSIPAENLIFPPSQNLVYSTPITENTTPTPSQYYSRITTEFAGSSESGTKQNSSSVTINYSKDIFEEENFTKKKLIEKEKHKVRQKVRRTKINTSLEKLKKLVPNSEEIECNNKKKKIDQCLLLDMTVKYIEQLHSTIDSLQKKNESLNSHHENFFNPNKRLSGSELSNEKDDNLKRNRYDMEEKKNSDDICTFKKRKMFDADFIVSDVNHEVGGSESTQSTAKFSSQKVLEGTKLLFLFAGFLFIFINPFSSTPEIVNPSVSTGRVLFSVESEEMYSSMYFVNLAIIYSILLFQKLFLFFSFVGFLGVLEFFVVPSKESLELAKKENLIGRKKFDQGDYDGCKRHFLNSLRLLNRSSPTDIVKCYYLLMNSVRQISHLLKFGIWIDKLFVSIRGEEVAFEIAKANHYLFALNILASKIDTATMIHFLESINSSESLQQRPHILAESYACLGLVLHGIFRFSFAYTYFMNKAWAIVDNSTGTEENSTIAYLLFYESYGDLCKGNLPKAEDQITHGAEIFFRIGNSTMWYNSLFVKAYMSFLRGNYMQSMSIIDSLPEISSDPRYNFWRIVVFSCNWLYAGKPELMLNYETLHKISQSYLQTKFHPTYSPTMEMITNSLKSFILLNLGEKEKALKISKKALEGFITSPYGAWVCFCGYYIAETLFSCWNEEIQKAEISSTKSTHISHYCHKLCTALRKISKHCELSQALSDLVCGKYASFMGEHEKASELFTRGYDFSVKLNFPFYKKQLGLLMAEEAKKVSNKVCSYN